MSSPTAGSSSPQTTSAGRWAVGGIILLWACLFAGLLGSVGWLLDLFSNFRVHYFVLFIALALVLMLQERKKAAFAALLGAAVAVIPLVSYMSLPGGHAEARPETFRVVTLNIWFRNSDFTTAARYLEETHADAIVVEELMSERLPELRRLLPSYPYVVPASTRIGATIFSRWPIVSANAVVLSDAANGSLAMIDWQGRKLSVLGVHLHWPLGPWSAPQRDRELRSIATFAAGFDGPLVVIGDLNTTPWSPYFRRLLQDSKLEDAARGQGWMPSWPSQFRPVGIRIDQCLVTPHWRALDVAPGPHVGSDHRPVVADLELREAAS